MRQAKLETLNPSDTADTAKVEFLKETPEFVNTDLETLGPFKKGDTTYIEDPIILEVLKDQDRIEVIHQDTEKQHQK